MSEPVIRVEGLSKKYLLRHEQSERYTALRDVIARRFRSLGRGLRHSAGAAGGAATSPAREVFWALRDISFEVRQGERVGIIGRNGAGKSTLLKILSRITEPTNGRIELEGRVASLLEVGTGFHPELTGRENIFLNGAILGMGRAEIRRKFEEIVAFAEVEKFLDTPVKRYSSGMYVRLAFAVAAHLEPEILIVDEVLAVGDAQFQKKCLGKMEAVGREGRTVLFVSHNMAAVQYLCSTALVLECGSLAFSGATAEAIAHYLAENDRGRDTAGFDRRRPAWARPLLTNARACDQGGRDCATFVMGQDLCIDISFDATAFGGLKDPMVGIVVNHATFGALANVSTHLTGFHAPHACAKATIRCLLRQLPFLPGRYTADVWLGEGRENVDTLPGCVVFDIAAGDVYGTGSQPYADGVVFLVPEFILVDSELPRSKEGPL